MVSRLRNRTDVRITRLCYGIATPLRHNSSDRCDKQARASHRTSIAEPITNSCLPGLRQGRQSERSISPYAIHLLSVYEVRPCNGYRASGHAPTTLSN